MLLRSGNVIRLKRLFDANKTYGQIVTFQAPKLFKECVDNAVKLYSAGSTEMAIVAEWNEVEPAFRKSLAALRACVENLSEISGMSLKEKKIFAKMFQSFDGLFAQLKSFTNYDDSLLEEYELQSRNMWDIILILLQPTNRESKNPIWKMRYRSSKNAGYIFCVTTTIAFSIWDFSILVC